MLADYFATHSDELDENNPLDDELYAKPGLRALTELSNRSEYDGDLTTVVMAETESSYSGI